MGKSVLRVGRKVVYRSALAQRSHSPCLAVLGGTSVDGNCVLAQIPPKYCLNFRHNVVPPRGQIRSRPRPTPSSLFSTMSTTRIIAPRRRAQAPRGRPSCLGISPRRTAVSGRVCRKPGAPASKPRAPFRVAVAGLYHCYRQVLPRLRASHPPSDGRHGLAACLHACAGS